MSIFFSVRLRIFQLSVETISIHPARCSRWLWENVRQPPLKVKCQNCTVVNWKIESKVDIVFKSHEVWERRWKHDAYVFHLPEVSVCLISFVLISSFYTCYSNHGCLLHRHSMYIRWQENATVKLHNIASNCNETQLLSHMLLITGELFVCRPWKHLSGTQNHSEVKIWQRQNNFTAAYIF